MHPIAILIGSKNPSRQPIDWIKPPMNIWPSPLPEDPIPSIMPVIVDVAFFEWLRPRSAHTVITIRWWTEPRKKPKKNMETSQRVCG